VIDVRLATISDAPTIAEVHVASWRAAYRELMPDTILAKLSVTERAATWASDIAGGSSTVFVATTDSSLIGLLAIAHSRDADAQLGTFEILALYVAPTSWSQGAGRALCLAADSFANSRGADRLTLWALTGNTRAHRFYSSIGFHQQTGTTRPYERHGLSLEQVRYAKPVVGLLAPELSPVLSRRHRR